MDGPFIFGIVQTFLRRLRAQKVSPREGCPLFKCVEIDPKIGILEGIHYRSDKSVITHMCTHAAGAKSDKHCSSIHEYLFFIISMFANGVFTKEQFDIITSHEKDDDAEGWVYTACQLGFLKKAGFIYDHCLGPGNFIEHSGWSNYMSSLLKSNPNDWKLKISEETEWPSKTTLNGILQFWHPSTLLINNKPSRFTSAPQSPQPVSSSSSSPPPKKKVKQEENKEIKTCHHLHPFIAEKLPLAMRNMEKLPGCCKPLEKNYDILGFMREQPTYHMYKELFGFPSAANRIKMWHDKVNNPHKISIARCPTTGSKIQYMDLDLDMDGPAMVLGFLKWCGNCSTVHHAKLLGLACMQRLANYDGCKKVPPMKLEGKRIYQMNFSTGKFPDMIRIKDNSCLDLNFNVRLDLARLIFFIVGAWADEELDKRVMMEMFHGVKDSSTMAQLERLCVVNGKVERVLPKTEL